jgi:two-component system sensor histidine kinase KdpD
MLLVRIHLDKAHIALVFLLVVLGASAAGGRALGLTIAAVAFLLFDFFFLPPFTTFVLENPLDWLVLVSFLVTSAVATQLLYRATSTAEEATRRAAEVDRLAALGAETLNAAGADEALYAIAEVIRHSLPIEQCEIYRRGPNGQVGLVARADRRDVSVADVGGHVDGRMVPRLTAGAQPGSLVAWILDHGKSAAELSDGTVRIAPDSSKSLGAQTVLSPGIAADQLRDLHLVAPDDRASTVARALANIFPRRNEPARADDGRAVVRAFAMPLTVRDHAVGVLRIAAAGGVTLEPEQTRLLIALAYYAALGVERARLVASAERAEAERRLEALRSALLTAVSHDLRTPLTTIKGIAHEIAHGGDASSAAIIETEADRLDALVADLLDLSRIHAGAVRPNIELNTADDLVGAALRRAAGAIGDRSVIVEQPEEELLAGSFDFSQSLRILVNLLDNAAKYSPSGSPITIRVTRQASRLEISVLDRGMGVPPAERERIFEPFYRPPGVPPDVRGTGLGLSIARGLAEAQGGSLRYERGTDAGSVFTLELPAADVPMNSRADGDSAG